MFILSLRLILSPTSILYSLKENVIDMRRVIVLATFSPSPQSILAGDMDIAIRRLLLSLRNIGVRVVYYNY